MLTVFSCSNYGGSCQNYGSVLVYRGARDYDVKEFYAPELAKLVDRLEAGLGGASHVHDDVPQQCTERSYNDVVNQMYKLIAEHYNGLWYDYEACDPYGTGYVSFDEWSAGLSRVVTDLNWQAFYAALIYPEHITDDEWKVPS